MHTTKDNEQLDIKRMIEVVLDRIVSIAVITLVFGLVFFAVSRYFITPKYESSITMYVNNRSDAISDNSETKTLASDITASQQLVPTYIEMLKSNSVLGEVSDLVEEETHQKYSESKIRKMMTAEAVSNTEIIKVSIRTEDATIARDIANAVAVVAEDKIPKFIQPSQVNIIDHAETSNSPVSPNVRNSIILGALIGLVLSVSVIILKEIFDVRVKSTDDLVGRFAYPVLGTIPEIYVSYDESAFDEDDES